MFEMLRRLWTSAVNEPIKFRFLVKPYNPYAIPPHNLKPDLNPKLSNKNNRLNAYGWEIRSIILLWKFTKKKFYICTIYIYFSMLLKSRLKISYYFLLQSRLKKIVIYWMQSISDNLEMFFPTSETSNLLKIKDI